MLGIPRRLSILVAMSVCLATGASPGIQEALADLQRGDFAAAERILQKEVRERPNDADALTLLGVALDGQKRYTDADPVHRRAAIAGPNSPDVWNNYANHLLETGDESGAGRLYRKVVALDPEHYNANVQLARAALRVKDGKAALVYLGHLPAPQNGAPNLVPLEIAALDQNGRGAEADRMAARWLDASKGNLGESFSIGVALAQAGEFARAENFLVQALTLAPSDFGVLFHLGVAAWQTGNYERALEVLEAARRQQPDNVDVLYNLACVHQAAKRPEAAVALLAKAAQLAPQRADIQKLLALATGDLGALADAAAAWDRYVKLAPGDDVGRRERGFTVFQLGRFEEGVADLRWFVARHPSDAVGHFELAAAMNKDNPSEALAEFDRALTIQPDFAAARSARGSLYYQMGKPEDALADLEAAARLRPDDPVSLDRLGQTYLALDRAADAVRVLRKSAVLAPEDSKTQLHLARALADAGEAAESKAAMERFRQLGPVVNRGVPGGLVDYLSLTPQQRHADYRARVERMVREHPNDATAQLTYLRSLLEDGDRKGAVETAHRIAGLKSASAALADAGRALLEARLYAPAEELLTQASAPGLELDRAIAAFHSSSTADGMRLLDLVPESARGSEYQLALAEMLDAAGRATDSSDALQQALRLSSGQSDIYRRACLFLLEKGRTAEALSVSEAARQALPRERRILLLHAIVLERAGRGAEAESGIAEIQDRWPEWPDAWLARGIVLRARGRAEDARAALRTAAALGIATSEDNPPELVQLLISR